MVNHQSTYVCPKGRNHQQNTAGRHPADYGVDPGRRTGRSGEAERGDSPALKGGQTAATIISVLYRSCVIPVAWHIRRANRKGSWDNPTVELLKELAPAVP